MHLAQLTLFLLAVLYISEGRGQSTFRQIFQEAHGKTCVHWTHTYEYSSDVLAPLMGSDPGQLPGWSTC